MVRGRWQDGSLFWFIHLINQLIQKKKWWKLIAPAAQGQKLIHQPSPNGEEPWLFSAVPGLQAAYPL